MHAVKQLFTRYKMLALLIAVALIWLFFSWQTEGGAPDYLTMMRVNTERITTGLSS